MIVDKKPPNEAVKRVFIELCPAEAESLRLILECVEWRCRRAQDERHLAGMLAGMGVGLPDGLCVRLHENGVKLVVEDWGAPPLEEHFVRHRGAYWRCGDERPGPEPPEE
jgi:hypothetical protein